MLAWRAFPDSSGATAGAYLAVPTLAAAGIRIAFTARAGGRSAEPFSSLNLSYVSGDDAATVRANRARALAAIGVPLDAWTSGRQVHGAGVHHVRADDAGSGALTHEDTVPETDALWTDEPAVALAVLTADCVPVALADPRRRRVAVVHAGWRGLVAGVVEAAAAVFPAPDDVLAFVGPSIGPCCYEVGHEVADEAAARLGASVLRDGGGERPFLDLWRGVRVALARARVGTVHSAALCTRCEPHRFYSHRAGHAARQGVLVAMDAGLGER